MLAAVASNPSIGLPIRQPCWLGLAEPFGGGNFWRMLYLKHVYITCIQNSMLHCMAAWLGVTCMGRLAGLIFGLNYREFRRPKHCEKRESQLNRISDVHSTARMLSKHTHA